MLVADRGLLALENRDALCEIRLASDAPQEFVLAVPGGRFSEFTELLRPFHDQHYTRAEGETIGELPWRNLRLIIAHNPAVARAAQMLRRERIHALEEQALSLIHIYEPTRPY